jgi:hypothetical protein
VAPLVDKIAGHCGALPGKFSGRAGQDPSHSKASRFTCWASMLRVNQRLVTDEPVELEKPTG